MLVMSIKKYKEKQIINIILMYAVYNIIYDNSIENYIIDSIS